MTVVTKDIWTIDAFSARRYQGNPCAVVFDADDLSQQQMQMIAAEMNLSETVFLLSPSVVEADYRARIFTPRAELPFAGHPTIAAAFAMVETGRFAPEQEPAIISQECTAGLIPVTITESGLEREFVMTQLPPRFRDAGIKPELAAEMLGCKVDEIGSTPIQAVSTGNWMLAVPVRSAEIVAALSPNSSLIAATCAPLDLNGVAAFSIGALTADCSVKVRVFAPHHGIPEDPVTGSANGGIGGYVARHRLLGDPPIRYTAEQGTELGRDGRVAVEVDSGPDDGLVVRVGGAAVKVLEGRIAV